jgi:RNA recognition motif-containing protein
MKIFVGNLDYKVKETDLESLFNEFGDVSSATIITDKFTGRSKGFGFVTMEDDSEGNKAIKELNGLNFKNRDLTVNEARPKTENNR